MKNKKNIFFSLSLLALMVIISAFTSNSNKTKNYQEPPKITKAICVLYPTKGNQANGIVTFIQMGGAIHVVADLHGLSKGKHGFHIHEFGDISAADGTSTGGHFNPGKMEHGAPTATMRHEGDMGNVEANENGDAHLEYMDARARIAYGVIGIAKSE
jgi:Cu-Zn family superoxide dismutase